MEAKDDGASLREEGDPRSVNLALQRPSTKEQAEGHGVLDRVRIETKKGYQGYPGGKRGKDGEKEPMAVEQ